jgi:hypothetical protein
LQQQRGARGGGPLPVNYDQTIAGIGTQSSVGLRPLLCIDHRKKEETVMAALYVLP